MRILHTGDWHLCDRLCHVDRTKDLSDRVEIIAALCEEHAVDLLLVAGDVFSEQATVDDMTAALTHLHASFAPFFQRGGTILAVTGNHDREARIEMLRAAMRLAAPTAGSRQFLPGRMYLLNRPYFGTFQSRAGEHAGERVQVVLVPYPTASRYAEEGDTFRSKEEENRVLQARVAEEIRKAAEHGEFDRSLPTLLAAHLHVRGAQLHTLYKLTEQDDVIFDAGSLPTAWSYIALGHIHKPQALGGMQHVRYPGSLDRLDFAERDEDKGVVLLDVGPAGLREPPAWITIDPTPLYDITLSDPAAELPELETRFQDRQTAIVRFRVVHNPAGPSRHEISQALRRLFPRLAGVDWAQPEGTNGEPGPAGFKARADYRSTIRAFLEDKLGEDPDKDDLLKLAEQYLTQKAEEAEANES